MRYNLPAAAQRIVNDAVLNAHRAAQDSHRITAPVAVRSIPFGQPFVIDSAPGVLFARVRDDLPVHEAVPVVAIATPPGQPQELGRVFGLTPSTTVRLVEVIQPMQVALA